MSFEIGLNIDIRVDGENLYRKCVITGALDDEAEPSGADINVHIFEFDDQPAQSFRFGFSRDENGLLEIALPNIGDPLTDYTLCVAGKVAPTVVTSAYSCFMETPDWHAFLICMKGKAPAIGYKALWALLRCTKKVIGID